MGSEEETSLATRSQEVSQPTLISRALELSLRLAELSLRNAQLEEENRSLKAAMDLSRRMVWRSPFYFQDGDAIPFCPRCFEVDGRAAHVAGLSRNRNLWSMSCLRCDRAYNVANLPPGVVPAGEREKVSLAFWKRRPKQRAAE